MQPDSERRARKSDVTPVVSTALHDGTLVETIYQRDRGRTSLVVGQGEQWAYQKSVKLASGETLVPISPANNLLKHEVILLPDHPVEYGDEAQLVADIGGYIHRYVDLSPTFEKIATYYVLLSWVYDAFNELPYLRFRGEFGSGKTRALLTVGSICYKAFFASGASTVSPIFHILDGFGGTLILDEADFRFSDEKAQLVKILNNGNVKGMPVLRTMPSPNGKEFNPKAFKVFSPKIVAARGSYDDRALESRFITEEMGLRSVRSDIPLNLPREQREEALTLRNKLLLYRLRNRHLMLADDMLASPALEARFNQILVPLLAVIDDRALQLEIQLHVRKAQADLTADRGQSVEGQVVDLLAELVAEGCGRTLVIAELVSRFSGKYGAESDRTMTGKWMGWILRRKLGLSTFRSSGSYYVSVQDGEALRMLFRRYGLAEDAATVPTL